MTDPPSIGEPKHAPPEPAPLALPAGYPRASSRDGQRREHDGRRSSDALGTHDASPPGENASRTSAA